MAKIINKKSSVVGKIPAPADLEYGELALNYADGKLFYKASNNSIQSFGGAALSNAVRQQFTATAGQTNFSINYTPGQLDVYLNGVKLVTGSDYTASSGTGFTLTTAATAGDIVDVVAGTIFASSDWQYITNKPTTLSGFGITDAQALSTNLTAISALTGTNGFLRTNGSGTWSVDTSAYITGNQNIVFSGDATGNGTTSVSLTLANSGVAAGTYTKVMVDAKGRVTNGYSLTSADLPTYTGTITSSQVTTALGFTPYNATNPSGYISGNQTITFSGDATGSGATSVSLTLANSGVTAGTYGSSTAVPVLVVDAKGRVTSVSTQSISGSLTFTGDVTGSGTTGTSTALTLANSGVTAGTYGSSTAVPVVVVDGKGRVTSISTQSISGALTFTGDVTGTGTTGSSTALTLANSGVTAGTYTKTTVDAKGRVTSGTTLSASDIPNLDASKITSGTIDAARLPSYVDDVLEYTNLASFPATGETAKIYVALDSNKTYRWSGSAYIEISASPGTTDSLVEGSTNLYFTNARARSAISVTQNLTYNSTTGVITGPNLSSYLTGNQTITFTGDATGSGATSVALTLANSGVTAGTYTKVTVDAKGRVTTGATLASADLPTYTGTITSSQITTGLGFTPYNSTNPSGYTSNTGTVTSVSGTGTVSGLTLTGTVTGSGSLTLGGTLSLTSAQVTTALGFTPYNSTNPSGYQTAGNINAYFGSATTNGTLDWNDVTNTKPGAYGTLLLGSATNGPGGGNYYHPFNLEYNSKDGTGNVTQMAVAYGTPGNELYMRGRYSGSWTGWTRYLNSSNYNSYSPTLTGGGASGTWGINITGNAATVTNGITTSNFSTYAVPTRTQSNWNDGTVLSNVVGLLAWRHYGNGHVIFDASTGTSPSGTTVDRYTPTYPVESTGTTSNSWGFNPNLMGWNGSATYGLKVDFARRAQSAITVDNGLTTSNYSSYALPLAGGTLTGSLLGTEVTMSGSILIGGTRANNAYAAVTGARLYFGGADADAQGNYYIGTNLENFGGNYNKLDLRWHTGIRMGAQASYGGIRFYDSEDLGSVIFSVGTGDANVRVANTLIANGISINQERAANARIYSNTTGGMGLLGVDSGGSFRWQLYGEGTNYGFLNAVWAGWDIRKAINGDLFVTVSSTERTVLHSGNYTSYSPSLTGSGASGTWSINVTGSAGSVSGLTLNNSGAPINPDNVTQNQIGYNTSVSLLGQTDGGLYSSAYSSSWIHQIYGDFRTGQIATRGKNNGTWQAWRVQLDSSNYTSYSPSLTGSGASGTWGISITGNAANVTGTVSAANGGTGRSSLTANNIVLGNGTSAVNFVAPGASGQVLTSNGTTWVSQAPTAGGDGGPAYSAY